MNVRNFRGDNIVWIEVPLLSARNIFCRRREHCLLSVGGCHKSYWALLLAIAGRLDDRVYRIDSDQFMGMYCRVEEVWVGAMFHNPFVIINLYVFIAFFVKEICERNVFPFNKTVHVFLTV